MNPQRIRGKIAEAGLTQEQTAKLAGMSGNSLSRKLTGRRDFKLSEVDALCKVLGISDPAPYFFENSVLYKQQREMCT